MQQISQLALTEFIKMNPYNGKCNYKSIKIIRKIFNKLANVATNLSRIEAVNQLMYILPSMEKSKELWMMCKLRSVAMRDEKDKKDLHHMTLLIDHKD